MKKTQERYQPFNHEGTRWEYATTVVAKGGRKVEFEALLMRDRFMDLTKELPYGSQGTCIFYFSSQTEVECDVYSRTRPLARTNTSTFRQGLGELLALMLQTGFTITAEKRGTPAVRQDINLDF